MRPGSPGSPGYLRLILFRLHLFLKYGPQILDWIEVRRVGRSFLLPPQVKLVVLELLETCSSSMTASSILHKIHFKLFWTLSLSEGFVKVKTSIMNVFVYIKISLVRVDRKISYLSITLFFHQ